MKQRYESSGELDYEFEELQLDDTDNVYDGKALISYEYEEGDLSVVAYGGFDWSVESLSLTIAGHDVEISDKKNTDLFNIIQKELRRALAYNIERAIKRHAEID